MRGDARDWPVSGREVAAEAAQESADSPAERLQQVLRPAVLAASGTLASRVGNPDTADVRIASGIRDSLPAPLLAAAGEPMSARALLLALALEPDPPAREQQLGLIAQALGPDTEALTRALIPVVDGLQPIQRMPALLCLFPALHRLTGAERAQLLSGMNGMLSREGRVSIHAYVLRKMAQVQLRDERGRGVAAGTRSLDDAVADLQLLFSVLATEGHDEAGDAQRAFDAGMQRLLPSARLRYAPAVQWPAALDLALDRLDLLAPEAKRAVVDALGVTIAHDGQLSVPESELLRAICASLHCPLPPLVRSG